MTMMEKRRLNKMEKDIIQPVNISILNDMLKEQEQRYEKEINKLKLGQIDFENKYMKAICKLDKIREYLEQREDIAKSMNELQTIQGIYNILGE